MSDLELALRYAPIISTDRAEPIPLRALGYTVFTETAPSRSFPGLTIEVSGDTAMVIEYALYFDYDIEHMYDLEHVFIMVDHDGQVIDARGSFHGKVLNLLMPDWPGTLEPEFGHIHIFLQPGKHAVLCAGELTRLFPGWQECCRNPRGQVLIGNPFCAEFSPTGQDLFTPTAEDNENCSRYLHDALSFEPTLNFTPGEIPDSSIFMPWEELFKYIPGWIAQECQRLHQLYS